MKALYLLLAISLGILGYLSYQRGQLASFHPLLDPAGQPEDSPPATDATSKDDSESIAELAEVTSPKPTSSEAEERARLEAKKRAELELQKQEEEQARKEQLEKEKAEAEIARRQAIADYEAKLASLKEAAKALDREYDKVFEQIKEARKNRNVQEQNWNREAIKTPEAEKEKLRAAGDQFLAQLERQLDEITAKIRENGRERRSLKRP